MSGPLLDHLLATLADGANAADSTLAWPAVSWQALCAAGGTAWSIPRAHGGLELPPLALLEHYEHLASTCLTTCFILSQRDAAVRRIRDSGHEDLCRELLPPLARGERFTTVGLSQLTTSRQHGRPALLATPQGDGFLLDGVMPWVTGAAQADYLITGAALDDGRQVLAVLPTDLPGVEVLPPLDLMALQGTLTGEVRCTRVRLERRWLLAGPAEKVLQAGRGGTGGLETSCLALGLVRAAVAYLQQEATARPELRPSTDRLEHARQALRQEMHRLAREGGAPDAASQLRARANTLVLRATQAALMASKGTGFLRQHPAQRWARQALFFLVWSCPRPTAEATLSYLAGPVDEACS